MRIVVLLILLLSVSTLKAQRFLPGSFIDNAYRGSLDNKIDFKDSTSKKKWFISKYSRISTSFSFFKGGNATVVSAPLGLQLNRRLNYNLFAFAGVSVAPAYVNFNRSFLGADFSKTNQNVPGFKYGSLAIYSRAQLGVQYVNDEKTFSISGSIGVERSSYVMPFYNNTRNTQVISANR